MNSMMQELGIDRMTPEQRVDLALEIWESLEGNYPGSRLTPDQQLELARRDAELDASPESALTWEQISSFSCRTGK